MLRDINRLLDPIRRKLLLIIGRAIVTAVNDDAEIQQIQAEIMKGEVKDKMERFQNYGFSSHPQPGAQAIALFNGGNRSNGVVVCVDDRRFRLKSLKPGEVAIYTDEGDSIVLGRGNTLKITTKKFELSSDICKIQASKFLVTDGTNEVLNLIDQLVEGLMSATVATSLGPQKLVNPVFSSLRQKLQRIVHS